MSLTGKTAGSGIVLQSGRARETQSVRDILLFLAAVAVSRDAVCFLSAMSWGVLRDGRVSTLSGRMSNEVVVFWDRRTT